MESYTNGEPFPKVTREAIEAMMKNLPSPPSEGIRPRSLTLTNLIESRLGLPVPFMINEFIAADSKQAIFHQSILQLSRPMYELLTAAIEDGDQDAIKQLMDAIHVLAFPKQPPAVIGLLGLPWEDPTRTIR